jgi:outer membrane phospholipase A
MKRAALVVVVVGIVVRAKDSAAGDASPVAVGDAPAPGAQGEIVRAPGAPSRTPIPEPVGGGSSRQYFFLHDDNYFSLRANGKWPPEAKFQLSLRFELVSLREIDNFALNFAYTQTSFWDVFNIAQSSPFIENDYRPELFVSFRPHREVRYREVQVGLQHQSNGLGTTATADQASASREWNYAFGEARWGLIRDKPPHETWVYLTPGLRAWIPFGVKNNLERYEGYFAVFADVDLRIPDHPQLGRLSTRVIVRQHNFEIDVFYPLFAQVRCWLFGQLFDGQAERLITAPQSVTHLYAGLGFQ